MMMTIVIIITRYVIDVGRNDEYREFTSGWTKMNQEKSRLIKTIRDLL